MRKWIIGFALCIATASFSFGQITTAREVVQPLIKTTTTGQSLPSVSLQQLEQSLRSSFQQTRLEFHRYPHAAEILETGPSRVMFPRLHIRQQAFYPNSELIESSYQLNRYFLLRHNQETLNLARHTEQLYKEIIQRVTLLRENQRILLHSAQEDIPWLASQTTNKTSYFLVGELHYYPEIQRYFSLLLQEIRRQNPHRQIFLFTEFLFDEATYPRFVSEEKPAYFDRKPYRQVWQTAQENNIRVIGLEPQFVMDNMQALLWYRQETADSRNHQANRVNIISAWGSPEGLRLRNAQWLETLTKYRKDYPEALFIVYGGTAHMSYAVPHSIGEALAGPKTFTTLLVPHIVIGEEKHPLLLTPFDKFTKGAFLDRVLGFDDEQLSRLAGFDVRIRVGIK